MTRRTEFSLQSVSEQEVQDAWRRQTATTNSAPELKCAIEEALAKLPDRDREIVSFRTGYAGRVMTLQELGVRHGVSPERIRQLCNRALRRLGQELSPPRPDCAS